MLLIPTWIAPSRIHGLGCFAAAAVAKDDLVWRFTPGLDLDLDPEALQSCPGHVRAYFAHYGCIDRRLNRMILCFDNARFVNHADDPNVAADYTRDPYGLDIALRDIAEGEEITMDYAGFETDGRSVFERSGYRFA